jgi:putative endonuclease
MEKGGFIYIITNKNNTVLYTGVTSNLVRRIQEHKNRVCPGSYAYRYNVDKLVYYEAFGSIEEAIAREKQIKAGSRKNKINLINSINSDWIDLYDLICGL